MPKVKQTIQSDSSFGRWGSWQICVPGIITPLPRYIQAQNPKPSMSLKAYSQIPPRVLWRELEIILQAPRRHQGSSGRVPGEPRESCKGAPGELHGSSRRAPEELQESHRGAPGEFHESCRRAAGELQESSRKAPQELQGSSRRAPGELQARAEACTNK